MQENWTFEYDEWGRLVRALDLTTGTETVYEYHAEGSPRPGATAPAQEDREEEPGRDH